MKRLLLIALLTTFAFSISAYAQEGQGQGEQHGQRHMPSVDDQVNDIKKAVSLSDDQASKVHDILQAQHDKMQQMMQDSSTSREDRRAKMQSLRQESHEQIRALLSDDQKKSFDDYLQKQQSEYGNRRGGHGPGSI